MANLNPAAFPAPLAELLARAPVNPLDAGRPVDSARQELTTLSDTLFAPQLVRDRSMANACRAGLWLRFNFLNDAHKISQDIETPEGSFWHGIVHRRDGDFDNAKYWFRRVGTHAVFEPLQERAAALQTVAGDAQKMNRVRNAWDPFTFIDLCAGAVRGEAHSGAFCVEVQRSEWELLFIYCWRNAFR
jgi:hypothetical protein